MSQQPCSVARRRPAELHRRHCLVTGGDFPYSVKGPGYARRRGHDGCACPQQLEPVRGVHGFRASSFGEAHSPGRSGMTSWRMRLSCRGGRCAAS
jgi:hypothetical protein